MTKIQVNDIEKELKNEFNILNPKNNKINFKTIQEKIVSKYT